MSNACLRWIGRAEVTADEEDSEGVDGEHLQLCVARDKGINQHFKRMLTDAFKRENENEKKNTLSQKEVFKTYIAGSFW